MPTSSSRLTSKRAKAAKSSSKSAIPEKALPVTLLSGFLGSGKTTLLKHILSSSHGLRIAVIVNDIGAINIDASLIKQHHTISRTDEKVIALQNGCICCTLRGDLLEELVRLAEIQQFDYVVVESSGISEPEQVAETFDARLAETIQSIGLAGDGAAQGLGQGLDEGLLNVLERVKTAGGLDKFARLDTTVTVIDAFTILNDFDTADLISSRRDDVVPEDERTVSDLMVDQIEFADVIVLNKVGMIDASMKARILELIAKLNHRAKVLESNFGAIDVRQIIDTRLFNLERAQTGYGWLEDLHAMTLREINGRKTVTPKPETEEYNIRNFVYLRRRPFHPTRLFELIHDKFILQLEHFDDQDDDEVDLHSISDPDEMDTTDDLSMQGFEGSDSTAPTSPRSSLSNKKPTSTTLELQIPSNSAILSNKRNHPLFGRLFRSKGEFFLTTRPQRAGNWSQAGAMLTLTGGREWFCILPEEEYTTGVPDIDEMVKHDIASGGEWGDRKTELVFIGEELDIPGIEHKLDQCLLNDDEWETWLHIMRDEALSNEEKGDQLTDIFEDGFPDWPDEDDHEGHDHFSHDIDAHKTPKHRITADGMVI